MKSASIWLCSASLLCSAVTFANDETPFTVGVRGGTSLNDRTESFRQVVGFAEYEWPVQLDLGNGFQLRSRVDFSAGWIRGEREEAAIGSLGPSAILYWKDFPLSLEGGSSPTLIGRNRFGNRDFGCAFQFTTHVGLNWDVTEQMRLGYRYQHMSNAGLGDSNPGLNMHMWAISWRF